MMDPTQFDKLPEQGQADDINSVKADPPDWVGIRTLLTAASRSKTTMVGYVVAALIVGAIGFLCFISYLMEH